MGWIRIEREIFDHDFFADDPMSEREAFIWMVARAAFKDTRHRVGSKVLDVPRGSFFATQRELMRAWRWRSLHRVQNFLTRLEEEGMIGSRTGSGKSHITICNYAEYQAHGVTEGSAGGQPGVTKEGNKQTTDDDRGQAREISSPVTPQPPDDAEPREILLAAMGLDPSGVTATGAFVGGMGDMAEQRRWQTDLGLSLAEQRAVIEEVMRRKRDGPPGSFKYFTKAMQEFAGRKTQPALAPIEGGHHGPAAPRGTRRGADAKSGFIRSFVEG